MTKNIQLIYELIQKDLKAQGRDDVAIAEAIAESQRERLSTGADDNTICVKELSYLSQESIQRIAVLMGNKKNKASFFIRIKNWIVNLAKDYWHLKWEAKIGVLFLIPPLIGLIFFILNLFGAYIGFDGFPESWNGIDYYDYDHKNYAATPAIPIYLGLMAIAGAYLIKGNLKINNEND